MEARIVVDDPKNPVLMIAPENEDSKVSFVFIGKRADFYSLHLQLKELFKENEGME